MVTGISNSFCVVFAPLLPLIPNFIQIGQKSQKLEILSISPFWLVGVVGQKLFFSYYEPPYQVSFKSDGKHKLKILVFQAGRSKNGPICVGEISF